VKPLVHVIRFYGVLKIRTVRKVKFTDISHQVLPALLLGIASGYCQRALLDES
jgi:hypothetical protein